MSSVTNPLSGLAAPATGLPYIATLGVIGAGMFIHNKMAGSLQPSEELPKSVQKLFKTAKVLSGLLAAASSTSLVATMGVFALAASGSPQQKGALALLGLVFIAGITATPLLAIDAVQKQVKKIYSAHKNGDTNKAIESAVVLGGMLYLANTTSHLAKGLSLTTGSTGRIKNPRRG